MSTTTEPLKYLWTAYFEDDNVIHQPPDDKYSKHIEGAEHNPSSFRDVLDYVEVSPIRTFYLSSQYTHYTVNIDCGNFMVGDRRGCTREFSLEDTPLTDRKLIFFRQVQQHTIGGVTHPPFVSRYILGYEGKNLKGKIEKKVIYIDG